MAETSGNDGNGVNSRNSEWVETAESVEMGGNSRNREKVETWKWQKQWKQRKWVETAEPV